MLCSLAVKGGCILFLSGILCMVLPLILWLEGWPASGERLYGLTPTISPLMFEEHNLLYFYVLYILHMLNNLLVVCDSRYYRWECKAGLQSVLISCSACVTADIKHCVLVFGEEHFDSMPNLSLSCASISGAM